MLIQRKPLGLFGACLLLGAQLAFAEPPMIFQHLGSPEGLPQNTVMSTLQDSQGFIWIATEDGLVRYDGYELRRYEHERGNPDSLPGNYIWSIAEDQHGDLWLAIKNTGLARWNRHTDRFTAFRHDPAHPGFSPSSDAVRQLLIDRHGHLWLATTGGGLNEFDPVAGSFKVLPPNGRGRLAVGDHTFRAGSNQLLETKDFSYAHCNFRRTSRLAPFRRLRRRRGGWSRRWHDDQQRGFRQRHLRDSRCWRSRT